MAVDRGELLMVFSLGLPSVRFRQTLCLHRDIMTELAWTKGDAG